MAGFGFARAAERERAAGLASQVGQQQLVDDHAQRCRRRDRDQGAQHAGEIGADQDRDDRDHRVHLQRPAAIHQGLDHAVLQLLVGEEDREPDEGVVGPAVDREHGSDDAGRRS